MSLRSQGYTLELLTNREARSIEPELNPRLPGFVFMPLRSQANPTKATRALAEAGAASGARIMTGQQVTSLPYSDDGVYRVETNRERFTASRLVIAAGAWCAEVGRMLGLRIPIMPVRGQMWAAESLPPRVFHTISSVESEYAWHQDPGNNAETPPELTHIGERRVTRHLYGRQNRDGEITFGGDRQLVGYNSSPDLTGIETNRGHAAEVLPLLQYLPIKRTWAGLMPFSLDGRPLIGKIPQLDNLYRQRLVFLWLWSRAYGGRAVGRIPEFRRPVFSAGPGGPGQMCGPSGVRLFRRTLPVLASYNAVQPPSTINRWPVVAPADGLAR